MDFTESDLSAVAVLQESQGVTVENAKQLYRKHVLKLANPDAPDRADIVLSAIGRGVEQATDEEVEESVAKPKKMTRNERRLARRAKETTKAKSKSKAPRKSTASKSENPRIECELAPLARDVELLPVADVANIYTASLFGRKHVAIWGERNRGNGASARFETVNLSDKRLDAAKKHGKTNNLPVAVCVTIRVAGRLDQGYAVPLSVFEKFEQGDKHGFALSGAARKEYGEQGWAGCKFSAKAVDSKAA
jgi:hypothetical protein